MSVLGTGRADGKWLDRATMAGCEQTRHVRRAHETAVPSSHFYDIHLTQNATLNRPGPDRLSHSLRL